MAKAKKRVRKATARKKRSTHKGRAAVEVVVAAASRRRPQRSDVIRELFVGGSPSSSDYRPLLAQMLKDAEMRAEAAEQKYKRIADQLVNLLTPDQLEAARYTGVTPEFYAIEFIELAKDKLFPKFGAAVRTFNQLNTGT